jgi:isoleucyl-tRNA synthetase
MTQATEPKKNYKSTLNLPQTPFPMEAKLVTNEPKRLAMWEASRLYERIQSTRANSPRGKWILHDGPPFANGDIHIGHLINKTLKDVILRFRTLQGYQTPYVPGWDCHGLPIEHKIQEQIKKEGKNLRELSTLEVRQRCHAYAANYVNVQCEQFKRLGILGEWNHPYETMTPSYEASTLEVFAKFVEAGLVYRKLKPVPWSIANQTALADAELEYQDVQDQSVYVEFPLIAPPSPGTPGDRRGEGDFERKEMNATLNVQHSTLNAQQEMPPTYLLVWTTTPWTLPANLAVAVHPEMRYECIPYRKNGEMRIGVVAAELVDKVFGRPGMEKGPSFCSFTGEDLTRMKYRHPFRDYVGPVVAADYVTTTDGTGLVHTAPGHGEDDYETGIREKLDVYSPVLANGRYDDTAPDWLRGKTVWEGNKLITQHLKDAGLLFAEEPITHSYPHDWRSKTPIIFRATEQWFVAMDKPFLAPGETGAEPRSLRDRAKSAIEGGVEFFPRWGQARLAGMLQSRPDWCISRQRAWGLPIPVFYNEKGEPLLTGASVRAVATHFAERGSDSWFTEPPTELLACDQTVCPVHFGETSKLRKEKDIFDVWFESGSSWHAVLQGRSYLHYPADLYLEGSDQHRGWFQLSMLPALGATGKPPFKAVLTHGFVVKPDGTKVSKSDKEYVKAVDEINRHGADVLRLWCCSVDYQNDIPASPTALAEFADKYRKIRNTLRYLLSNLYDLDPRSAGVEIAPNSLDGWIIDRLDTLIDDVSAAYDTYQLHRAFRLLHDFCSVDISAIYGNAMKDRLYCEAPNAPLRRRCQATMHRLVITLTKLLSPMLVFTADEAWEQIPHKPAAESDLPSVHIALLPEKSNLAVPDAVRHEWRVLMELRESALMQLDALKKEAGLNKSVDAEVVYHIADAGLRDRLAAYGPDLEDLLGAGFHSLDATAAAHPSVQVVDSRGKYAACARSWKRRPDVGADPQHPDLSARDAAAVRAAESSQP